VFGETFGPLRLAGMVLVIGGIAVMLLFGRTRKPKASEPAALTKTA
jgi:O-acetylserine/cysteine efflux transporter